MLSVNAPRHYEIPYIFGLLCPIIAAKPRAESELCLVEKLEGRSSLSITCGQSPEPAVPTKISAIVSHNKVVRD